MSLEGRLGIDLYETRGKVVRVAIASGRPLRVADLFRGRTPREMLDLLPRIYTVCGAAHVAAAAAALECAQGISVSPALRPVRAMSVLLETAREHLWRILTTWPGYLDAAPEAATMAEAVRLVGECRQGLFPERAPSECAAEPSVPAREMMGSSIAALEAFLTRVVFGVSPADWRKMRTERDFKAWAGTERTIAARVVSRIDEAGWSTLGATAIEALPAIAEASLHRRLERDDAHRFIARPRWSGRCYETSAYARQSRQALIVALRGRRCGGLTVRLAARLLELARIPGDLRAFAEAPPDAGDAPDSSRAESGTGLAQVEAARGRLIHRVVLRQDRLVSFQIVAPTEWNFHPQGVVVEALTGLDAKDERQLRRQASLIVDAVDPCVGYEIKVH